MEKLQDLGARNILCSLGKDGAELLTEDKRLYYVNAPSGELVNSLGAGDSMVAGFIYEYLQCLFFLSLTTINTRIPAAIMLINKPSLSKGVEYLSSIV